VLLHTGTSITPAITIDFLTLDDNDGNLGNGSPHYSQINAGFSDHGMPGPALQLLDITFPSGRPEFSNPSGGTSFPVVIAPFAANPAPGTGTLRYRVGSTPATVYEAVVASGSGSSSFVDTVETDLGWSLTAAGDTATTGQWVRGDPNGTTTAGVPIQPENDVTAAPGVNCF